MPSEALGRLRKILKKIGVFRAFVDHIGFYEVFACVWTCSDMFGYARMHSHAFGCAGTRLDTFRTFRISFILLNDFGHFWIPVDLRRLL